MMKLIDILNLIAKGELEEGTKIKLQNTIYTFGEDDYSDGKLDLFYKDSYGVSATLFENQYLSVALNEEVVMIGKDTNVSTKIEELQRYGKTIFNYGDVIPADWVVCNKLNEVIRELNRRGE